MHAIERARCGAAGASMAFRLRSDCPDVHTSTPSSYAQLLERETSRTGAHVSDTAGYCRLEGPHVAPECVGLPALSSERKGGCAQTHGGKRNQHTRHIFSGAAQKKKVTERARAANPAFRSCSRSGCSHAEIAGAQKCS